MKPALLIRLIMTTIFLTLLFTACSDDSSTNDGVTDGDAPIDNGDDDPVADGDDPADGDTDPVVDGDEDPIIDGDEDSVTDGDVDADSDIDGDGALDGDTDMVESDSDWNEGESADGDAEAEINEAEVDSDLPDDPTSEVLTLDADGRIDEEIELTGINGSVLSFPAGSEFTLDDGSIAGSGMTLGLDDAYTGYDDTPNDVAELLQLRIHLSDTDDQPVEAYFREGLDFMKSAPQTPPAVSSLLTLPTDWEVSEGEQLVIFKRMNSAEPASDKTDDGTEWIKIGLSVYHPEERIPVSGTGVFLIGRYVESEKSRATVPGNGMELTYIGTAEVSRFKLVEPNTSEILAAFLFDTCIQTPPADALGPHVSGDAQQPFYAWLDQSASGIQTVHIRSAYANKPKVYCVNCEDSPEQGPAMGPYPVANDNVSDAALENPYEQCDESFAGWASFWILMENGSWSSFKNTVMTPLRDQYGYFNVKRDYYKKVSDTLVTAEVSVWSTDCTDDIASFFAQEADVALDGRFARVIFQASCKGILLTDPDAASGIYAIHPDGAFDSDALEVYCDMDTDGGGWTVIDYQRAPGWSAHFESWTVYADGKVAGPSTGANCTSWTDWFSLDIEGTEFRRSPACAGMSGENMRSYHMTGNYFGCTWYNTNCGETADTCYQCAYTSGATPNPGQCTHMDDACDDEDAWRGHPHTKYCDSCSGDWWNFGPSLGLQGKFCQGYR